MAALDCYARQTRLGVSSSRAAQEQPDDHETAVESRSNPGGSRLGRGNDLDLAARSEVSGGHSIEVDARLDQ